MNAPETKPKPVSRCVELVDRAILNLTSAKPDSFRHRLIERLSRSTWIIAGLRRGRDVIYGVGWGAFHCDNIYRQLMLELIGHFQFTSFVETGTCRGYSTEFMARAQPRLRIFSSEVMPESYEVARKALAKYPNISVYLGNSSDWVGKMVNDQSFGNFPLFYLDAHWQRYWPLRDELRHIAAVKLRAIIVIDDFEVPGHPDFGFDVDGGGTVVEGEKCNLDYIRPALLPGNSYHVVFPKYSREDAKISSKHGTLRGHVIVFQNAAEDFQAFCRLPFFHAHYFSVGETGQNPVSGQAHPKSGTTG
jgi:hypothetical protein